MAALTALLPKPKQTETVFASSYDDDDLAAALALAKQKRKAEIPPYGQRAGSGWVPRAPEDWGDGGAYPEIHTVQFPLNMGKPRGNELALSQPLTLQVDETGKLRYDLLARQGHNESRIIHSSVDAVKPKDMTQTFEKPDDDTVRKTTEETRLAMEKLVSGKIKSSLATQNAVKNSNEAPQFIRYTPAQQNEALNSGAQQRVIRMVEMPVDPMEPPKHRHKRLPKGPPSPPPPVLHSPPRKVTAQEQAEWKIPPCISNWKNPKGYTIPLDKRLAADGRGLQETVISDKFAKLSQTLYIADRQAREEVAARNELQKRIAQAEKEKKEEKLRELAAQAREERSGLALGRSRNDNPEEMQAEREREKIRHDREKEIQRDMRMNTMGKETKSKILARAQDRDISEKIALGLAQPTMSKEMMYDQRLFNQPNAATGYGVGDEEAYNVYDKPLFAGSAATAVYHHKKSQDDESFGSEADMEKLRSTDRFQPDKGFSGADKGQKRAGPVEFEKEEDPFGIDQFLNEAKKGKRSTEDAAQGGSDSKRSRH